MKTGFSAQAHGAVLDFTGDDDQEQRQRKGATVWDKKSKKYVRVQDDKKRIKTESGVYINASYKTNRYAKWKERSKLSQQEDRDNEDEGEVGLGLHSLWSGGTGQVAGTFSLHWMWQAKPQTSQTTPCRVRPTMMEVQWLHLSGDENVRMRN